MGDRCYRTSSTRLYDRFARTSTSAMPCKHGVLARTDSIIYVRGVYVFFWDICYPNESLNDQPPIELAYQRAFLL